MELSIIGYLATSTSIIAFGSQFVHTIKTKSTEGLSLHRTVLDVVSLALWLSYAARSEDIPLLIATGCELVTSLCVCVSYLKTGILCLYLLKTIHPHRVHQMNRNLL